MRRSRTVMVGMFINFRREGEPKPISRGGTRSPFYFQNSLQIRVTLVPSNGPSLNQFVPAQ